MKFRQDLWDKLKNEGYIINPPELDDENDVEGINPNNKNQGLILKNTFSLCIGIPKNKSIAP